MRGKKYCKIMAYSCSSFSYHTSLPRGWIEQRKEREHSLTFKEISWKDHKTSFYILLPGTYLSCHTVSKEGWEMEFITGHIMPPNYLGLSYKRGVEGCWGRWVARLPRLLTFVWCVLIPLAMKLPNRQRWEGAVSDLLCLACSCCQSELNLTCVRKPGPLSAEAASYHHFCLNFSTLQRCNLANWHLRLWAEKHPLNPASSHLLADWLPLVWVYPFSRHSWKQS